MRILGLLAAGLLTTAVFADIADCGCDATRPETLAPRECSLCREAEKVTESIFFLKDINPRKPNRWLALPKVHGKKSHPLHELTATERTELWTAAIRKATELWGKDWGLAYNGSETRTQCHGHIHIGKLVQGVETTDVVTVAGPADIPVNKEDVGIWVHPVGEKLHVHGNEQITESVLLR